MSKEIQEGRTVVFYDCDRDKEMTGDRKFYSVGLVIKRRRPHPFSIGGYTNIATEDVVDIQLSDGRISKGHFVSGVKIFNQQNT